MNEANTYHLGSGTSLEPEDQCTVSTGDIQNLYRVRASTTRVRFASGHSKFPWSLDLRKV